MLGRIEEDFVEESAGSEGREDGAAVEDGHGRGGGGGEAGGGTAREAGQGVVCVAVDDEIEEDDSCRREIVYAVATGAHVEEPKARNGRCTFLPIPIDGGTRGRSHGEQKEIARELADGAGPMDESEAEGRARDSAGAGSGASGVEAVVVTGFARILRQSASSPLAIERISSPSGISVSW